MHNVDNVCKMTGMFLSSNQERWACTVDMALDLFLFVLECGQSVGRLSRD